MVSAQPFLDYRSLKSLGPLSAPNSLGLRLPAGFTGQLLAQGRKKVRRFDGTETAYSWHTAPDGGACFATPDGGWIYVSNSEVNFGGGGAGALRFDNQGRVIDAYSILSGTNNNCAGGPTPWGTWLSCEEVPFGSVYECDPLGRSPARKCPGLGNFKHEAIAIDPVAMQAYLTEDEGDGRFYRYTPGNLIDGRMNLDEGLLEVALVDTNGRVQWESVKNANPSGFSTPTRKQIRESRAFDGGEGIWHHEGRVYFTTKGDNRVWTFDIAAQSLSILYDRRTAKTAILSGVDNVTVSRDGHVLVAEDGGDMQICVLGPFGDVYPLLQLVDQDGSEITGPAISPDHKRLYFSSQRGQGSGLTYEILGSFA
jgi:secreted PhoX family phosphatase